MPEFPEIPVLSPPPIGSIYAFSCVIMGVIVAATASIWHPDCAGSKTTKVKWTALLMFWVAAGAAAPLTGVLRLKLIPPPGFVFVALCLVTALWVGCSGIGKRLSNLPFYWLVGFHAFRLPLELILHDWYSVDFVPVQMTWAGWNVDVLSGILAIGIGLWCKRGSPPRAAIWLFNCIGSGLLLAVMVIANLSVPTPFRLFSGTPLLLPFYFPFSYIVSIAVSGAFVGHLVLFRKLISTGASHGNR